MISSVVDIVTTLRRRLGIVYGERLLRVILFGSQARGDAEADSDIDVMLVLADPVRPGAELKCGTPITAKLFDIGCMRQ